MRLGETLSGFIQDSILALKRCMSLNVSDTCIISLSIGDLHKSYNTLQKSQLQDPPN